MLLAAVVWLILRAARQQRLLPALSPAPSRPSDAPVAVIVPARDEAASIDACLSGLLAQDHAALSVIVVDDASADATAAIVSRRASSDPRVRLIAAPRLAPGWTGKCQACWGGAR